MFANIRLRFRCTVLMLTAPLSTAAFAQIPANNPYTTHYRIEKDWTDEIPWKRVTDVTRAGGVVGENGRVDSARLHQQLEALSEKGGVLYFPAGTYYFDFDVRLYSNTVIRGAEPVTPPGAPLHASKFPTRFEFPRYEPAAEGAGTPNGTAFKRFSAAPKGEKNFGLVHLDLNRASIDFYSDWPAAAHDNVIVFGIRQNNAATPDPKVPSKIQADEKHGWQRWPAWYKENIVVCAESRCIVANCRLNDEVTDDFRQAGFMTDDGYVFRSDTINFSYTYHQAVTLYVKAKQNETRITDNYIRSTRHFPKINVPERTVRNENNTLADTPDEKEFALVNLATMTATALQMQITALFEKQQYLTPAGEVLRYRILKPKNYDPRVKYPLMLFFHGGGERGEEVDNTGHFVQLFAQPEALENHPCFVVVPELPKKGEWVSRRLNDPPSQPMQASLSLMAELQKQYSIDRKRLYVSGISAGGKATWEVMLRYPKRFAAGVPMAALYNVEQNQMPPLRKMSIYIAAGAQDQYVPVQYVRMLAGRLSKAAVAVTYKEYADVGHFSWVPLYTDKEFLPWLFSQRR